MVYIAIYVVLSLLGLVIDVASLLLGIKRLRGTGPSGIPIVSLIVYLLAALFIASIHGTNVGLIFFAVGAAIHLFCQYGLLFIFDLLIER